MASTQELLDGRADLEPVSLNRLEVRAWRRTRWLTQPQLAQLLGVRPHTVYRWESGESSVPSFLKLALDQLDTLHYWNPERHRCAAADWSRLVTTTEELAARVARLEERQGLATKADLADVRVELSRDIAKLATGIGTDLREIRAQLTTQSHDLAGIRHRPRPDPWRPDRNSSIAPATLSLAMGAAMKRRTSSQQQNNVVVGWVEVWSTTPGEGFAVEGTVPLSLPRLTARFEDGHYRLRERKSLTLPQEPAA